jgi:hypothetical protein
MTGAGARCPGDGCNSEMLELETRGPVSRIEPGGYIDHDEIWQLRHAAGTESEADIDALIAE